MKTWAIIFYVIPLLNVQNIIAAGEAAQKGSRAPGRLLSTPWHCSSRVEGALERMRELPTGDGAQLELVGYALHQPLRSVPFDMYVTDMSVKLPGTSSWYRIEHCDFDPRNTSLDMRLMFHDLLVTGVVKLFDESSSLAPGRVPPADSCNMTLRLRRAGLSFTAYPRRVLPGSVEIVTNSQNVEPDFVSVFAYGCRLPHIQHRAGSNDVTSNGVQGRQLTDVAEEMETVFVRGIQALLTTYMQKQLQPAIKDTLMVNMGYTVSYGK